MRVAILAKNSYDNRVAIAKAMEYITSYDQLYLDTNSTMCAEQIAANIALMRSINLMYVPHLTKIADAVLIIYEDGEAELHEYPKEYYDESLIRDEVLV